MKNNRYFLKKLIISALFLALGLILPSFTMQIPDIGNALLPMHLPVLLCGMVCGWQYGTTIGFATPLLRSFWFGMPFLYPKALGMAFELAAYGALVGIIFHFLSKGNKILASYLSLIPAMIGGRIVWGIISAILYSPSVSALADKTLPAFTFKYFITESVVLAVPGIILQLVLIPLIIQILVSAKLLSKDGKLN